MLYECAELNEQDGMKGLLPLHNEQKNSVSNNYFFNAAAAPSCADSTPIIIIEEKTKMQEDEAVDTTTSPTLLPFGLKPFTNTDHMVSNSSGNASVSSSLSPAAATEEEEEEDLGYIPFDYDEEMEDCLEFFEQHQQQLCTQRSASVRDAEEGGADCLDRHGAVELFPGDSCSNDDPEAAMVTPSHSTAGWESSSSLTVDYRFFNAHMSSGASPNISPPPSPPLRPYLPSSRLASASPSSSMMTECDFLRMEVTSRSHQRSAALYHQQRYKYVIEQQERQCLLSLSQWLAHKQFFLAEVGQYARRRQREAAEETQRREVLENASRISQKMIIKKRSSSSSTSRRSKLLVYHLPHLDELLRLAASEMGRVRRLLREHPEWAVSRTGETFYRRGTDWASLYPELEGCMARLAELYTLLLVPYTPLAVERGSDANGETDDSIIVINNTTTTTTNHHQHYYGTHSAVAEQEDGRFSPLLLLGDSLSENIFERTHRHTSLSPMVEARNARQTRLLSLLRGREDLFLPETPRTPTEDEDEDEDEDEEDLLQTRSSCSSCMAVTPRCSSVPVRVLHRCGSLCSCGSFYSSSPLTPDLHSSGARTPRSGTSSLGDCLLLVGGDGDDDDVVVEGSAAAEEEWRHFPSVLPLLDANPEFLLRRSRSGEQQCGTSDAGECGGDEEEEGKGAPLLTMRWKSCQTTRPRQRRVVLLTPLFDELARS